MSKAREIIALARHSHAISLLKSKKAGNTSAGQDALQQRLTGKRAPVINPARPKRERPKLARVGEFVRVHRPDMKEPALARLLAQGKDGVTVVDANNRQVRVRHEHITEPIAQPTGRERAEYARALADRGVPATLEERYMHLGPDGQPARRATSAQLGLVQLLAEHGIPVDVDAVRAGASYDDAQAIIERFISEE